VEAVYNPLPNHLHLPWSLRTLEAGKHLLCEKPIGMDAGQAQALLDAARRRPQLKVMEAFMYRHHPQWQRARQIVAEGGIGALRTVQSFFSFYNVDPANIRNQAEAGGGALMDIGCYCISLARLLFGAEPHRVLGTMEIDPAFGVDRITSGILEFAAGTSTFTCATQLAPYQRVQIVGSEGRVEIEVPFNPRPELPTRLWHQRDGGPAEEVTFPPCDHYAIQGDLFALAVRHNEPVPTPLEDAVANMRALDAVAHSAKAGAWFVLDCSGDASVARTG
jgi:predicted dehydrogenase